MIFISTHISNLIPSLNAINCRYISKHGVNLQVNGLIDGWFFSLFNANPLQIWIVRGFTNDFHSISDEKGKGSMLDLFFQRLMVAQHGGQRRYKVVYPLGTSVCNIVKKTNGTCEVLCQNFFIGRQQVNSCRTMSRVARFACNQHFSQVRCIHTHACTWSSSMVRRIRIWLVAKEKLRQFGVRKRTRLLPIISETVSPFCWLMTICVGGETGIKAIPSEFSLQRSTVVRMKIDRS